MEACLDGTGGIIGVRIIDVLFWNRGTAATNIPAFTDHKTAKQDFNCARNRMKTKNYPNVFVETFWYCTTSLFVSFMIDLLLQIFHLLFAVVLFGWGGVGERFNLW